MKKRKKYIKHVNTDAKNILTVSRTGDVDSYLLYLFFMVSFYSLFFFCLWVIYFLYQFFVSFFCLWDIYFLYQFFMFFSVCICDYLLFFLIIDQPILSTISVLLQRTYMCITYGFYDNLKTGYVV